MSDRDQQWRDARFKKALDNAPDLAERPAGAVRDAILSKARATAAEAAAARIPAPRKRAGWWSLGLPWNSALGTVAAVCLVSVLWWREELPKQAEESVPVLSVPAPAPAVPAESQAEAKADALRAERAAASEKKIQPPREARARAPIEVKIVPQSMPEPEVTIAPMPVPAPAPAPFAPPPPPAKATVASPPAAQFSAVPPPPPAPVAAPAPVQALPYARSSESTLERVTVTGQRAVVEVVPWTALRVRTPTGPALLAQDRLSENGQLLLQQQLRDQRRAADLAASGVHMLSTSQPPGLVVEVLDGDRVVARLELLEGQLREQVEAALASKPR